MKIKIIFILSSLAWLMSIGLSSDVFGQNYTQKNFHTGYVGKCNKFIIAGKDVTEKGPCIIYMLIPGFKEGGKTPQIIILTHTEGGYRERKETARIEFEVAKLTSTSNGDTEFIINSITTMGSHPNEIAGISVSGTCKLRRIDAMDSEIFCNVEKDLSPSGNFSVSFKQDDLMLDPDIVPTSPGEQREFIEAANRFLDGTTLMPQLYPPKDLGNPAYYRFRYNDFVKRNPNRQPPSYYLNFGEKYITRFMNETYPNLTVEGQTFLKKVAKALQQKIENKLSTNPKEFVTLEEDPNEEFSKFAYGTHPDAYCESGWGNLPKPDRDKIIEAVDRSDLYFSIQGIITGIELANKCGYYKDAIPLP
jgi:hypothetical protein